MMPMPRFRASLLVLALAAGGFAGCSREPTAQEHLQAARAFLAAGDHKAALIELKNTLAQQPSNAEVRFLLGSSYLDLLQPASAEIELRRALELGYDRVAVLTALSRSLSGQDKHQKVLDELAAYRRERGSELPPELLTMQATAQLALGQVAQATASLNAALQQAPTHAPAHLGLAWVATAASDTDATLRHIEEAIRHRPDDPEAWMFKGDTFRRKSLPKEAEADYKQAIAVGPKDLRPHLRLIDLYATLGRYDEARAEIAQVRKVEPQHVEAMYQLAALAIKELQVRRGRRAVQQVLKRYPDHALSMLVAGTAAHYLGKTEAADKYLSAYLKRDPRNAFARKLLAANFLQAKQPALALETVAPLAVRSEDITAVAIAGTAALESRQFVKAVGYLERAVALAPKDAGLRTKLAASRMGLGETLPGIADLEVATRLDEKSARPDVMLIMTHLTRRDYDKALAAIALMEKKSPRDPAVYNLRGLALEGKKDPAGARTNFEKALSLQPDYFVAASNLAAQDFRAGNREAARERFTRLLEKNPATCRRCSPWPMPPARRATRRAPRVAREGRQDGPRGAAAARPARALPHGAQGVTPRRWRSPARCSRPVRTTRRPSTCSARRRPPWATGRAR